MIGSNAAAAILALQTAYTTTTAARDAAGVVLDATPATNAATLSTLATQAGVAAGMAATAGYVGRALFNVEIGAV